MTAWVVAVIAVFVFASRLEPSPRGYGTHQQLGFPPCTFRVLWQIPCPSCGGTTAFAWFVRGNWPAAASANIGAFFLAVVMVLSVPWCFISMRLGRTWKVSDPLWAALVLMLVFVGLTGLLWIGRLVVLRFT
jgi:hypothetical protein